MQQRSDLRYGFSLIEMLVVMAVTAVLLTVITVPLYQSFQITRGAQSDANAQDAIRQLNAKITKEIKQAAGVYDNTGDNGKVVVSVPGLDGTISKALIPSSKIILAEPARESLPVDPKTGKVDPTQSGNNGATIFPATPGTSIVMYIVGLKDPFRLYNNPYEQFKRGTERWDYTGTVKQTWTAQFKGEEANHQASNEDNMYVLYRIVVNPYSSTGVVDYSLFTDLSRVDKAALATSTDPADKALLKRANTSTGPDVNDPYLLDLSRPSPVYTSGATLTQSDPADLNTSPKAQMIRNLLRHATVVTDVNHLDMILPQVDKSSLKVAFDGNVPRIESMAIFRPEHVNSEPASAQLAIQNGDESVNATKVGPATYRTQLGSWNDINMRIYPSHYPATGSFTYLSVGAPRDQWGTTDSVIDVLPNANNGLSVYANAADEMFNITLYQQLAGTPYAFSKAVVTAGVAANPTAFIPVVPNASSGSVQASFPIEEFGNPADRLTGQTDFDAYKNNIPSSSPSTPGVATGPLAFINDPAYAGSWTTFTTPNERFASLWQNWETLFPGGNAPAKDGTAGPKRYVDLRFMPMFGASATFGPLDPRNGVARATITPGSDVVYGPDQSPNAQTGAIVQYTRVPNSDTVPVGPNQYKINYVDRAEPDWAGVYGFSSPNYDPLHFDSTFSDFLSVVMQARYRAGYLELNSSPDTPLPVGNIYVSYRFQFTEPKDVVTVSYDTAKSIETVMSVANYGNPTVSLPAITTISGSAEVRNLLR